MVATITIYVQICGAYKLRGCHKSSIFVIQGSLAHQDFTDFVERPLSSGYTSDMIEDIITYSFKQCFDQEIYIRCIEIALQSRSESTVRGHSE